MIMQRICAVLLLAALAACAGIPDKDAKQPTAAAKVDPTALLTGADAARESGRYADALAIYQQLLVEHPDMAAPQYGVAESMLALGKANEAKPLFEGLVNNDEFHARALQGQGLAQLALNERQKAAKTLREAIEADPELWRSWNALGLIADGMRETDKAQADYEKALALNPNSAVILNNIGYSKLMAKKPVDAARSFRKALALEPASETIENNLRLAIAAKGDYAEATKFTRRDKLPNVLNNVGVIAMQRGDYPAAEGYFVRAMESSNSYYSVAAKNLDELKSLTGKDRAQ